MIKYICSPCSRLFKVNRLQVSGVNINRNRQTVHYILYSCVTVKINQTPNMGSLGDVVGTN